MLHTNLDVTLVTQVTLRLKTVKIKNNLVYSRFELKAMTLNDVTLYLINLHGDNNMIRMTSFLSSFNSVLMVIGTLLQSTIQTFMKHQDKPKIITLNSLRDGVVNSHQLVVIIIYLASCVSCIIFNKITTLFLWLLV